MWDQQESTSNFFPWPSCVSLSVILALLPSPHLRPGRGRTYGTPWPSPPPIHTATYYGTISFLTVPVCIYYRRRRGQHLRCTYQLIALIYRGISNSVNSPVMPNRTPTQQVKPRVREHTKIKQWRGSRYAVYTVLLTCREKIDSVSNKVQTIFPDILFNSFDKLTHLTHLDLSKLENNNLSEIVIGLEQLHKVQSLKLPDINPLGVFFRSFIKFQDRTSSFHHQREWAWYFWYSRRFQSAKSDNFVSWR